MGEAEEVNDQQVLEQLRAEIEEWKTKAKDLQVSLDELKGKYHDLEAEEKKVSLENNQLTNDVNVITKENEGIQMKIDKLSRENEEVRRRISESLTTKEKVSTLRNEKNKLESKLDRLKEYLEKLKDDLAEVRIENLKNNIPELEEDVESKDTHVDLSMEMFITHNKTVLYTPTYAPIYYSTEAPSYYSQSADESKSKKCLISYYGVTNETCWYETDGERSEDSYVDALGHHLVEAHWKYFTIDVKDQSECDKASHLHYEFLINRCSPKHYLPVMSCFQNSPEEKKVGCHFYPKVQNTGGGNTCWITFLGAHGHCEAHNDKFNLYNTADTAEGYGQGSGGSADHCLARADWWMNYCNTPVLAPHVPTGVSSNWQKDWIMHDSHGGKMFEESGATLNHINPDSLHPNAPINHRQYQSEFKSQAPKSPDYHDSPEYRKSLHLQGAEKEELLQSLRHRLGMSGKAQGFSRNVLQHEGVNTGDMNVKVDQQSSSGSNSYAAPAEYSTEAPAQEYSSEAPSEYSSEAPAEYSSAPAPEYSSEAPAEYSSEAPAEYSSEAPAEYSSEAP